MQGLILKDLYMLKKYCGLMLVVVIAFVLYWAAFTDANPFFDFYPTILIGVLPITLQSYDEMQGWYRYSGGLPYTRAQLVLVKYLMGLFLTTFVCVVKAAASFALRDGVDLTSVVTAWAMGLVPSAVFMPFAFKFGAEKARLFMLFGIGATSAVSLSFLSFNGTSVIETNIAAIVVCGAIVLYALSYFIASALFKKRDL